MGDWCGSFEDRRHAIENRDAYRLGYPSGHCYWEHDLKKIVLKVILPIDTGPANDEMDPSLFSYGLGWATMEILSTIKLKKEGPQ